MAAHATVVDVREPVPLGMLCMLDPEAAITRDMDEGRVVDPSVGLPPLAAHHHDATGRGVCCSGTWTRVWTCTPAPLNNARAAAG